LLLVTTFPAMFLAAHGFPPLGLAAVTFVGGTLSAASANVFNSVLDADIDEQMRRTRRRPDGARAGLAARPPTRSASCSASGRSLMLGFGANWLSAALSVVAILYYVFIYTVWLKRRTPEHRVGRRRRLLPAADRLDGRHRLRRLAAAHPVPHRVLLDAPAHVGAGPALPRGLRGRRRPDAARGEGRPHVTRQILVYSVLTVATSLALWPVAGTGWLYPAVAGASGR
jgi:protoheme IX farnesyltransferase